MLRASLRPAVALAALLLAACAGAPAPEPAAPTSVVVPAQRPAPPPDPGPQEPPSEPAPPKPPPGPPRVALPDPAACVLEAVRWRGAQTVTELRFREGGPIFAQVTYGKARLHLPAGAAAQGAGLEIAQDGLALRGHIAGAAIAFRPARALVIGEIAIPTALAALGWTEAKPGEVAVTFDPGDGVDVLRPPLSAPAPCDALTLDTAAFDARAAVPGVKTDRRALLRVGRPILLSIEPGGAPAAKLLAKDDVDAEVTIIDAAPAQSRVRWERHRAVVFGWVPSSEVRVPKPGPAIGHGYGTGTGGSFGRSVHPVARVVCPADVTVVAEAEGERATVGSVLQGTTINVMDRGAEEVEVVIRSSGIQIPSPVRLLARADQLKGCPPAP